MKPLLLSFLILLAGNSLFAQHAHFTTSGTVEFEKTINVYALIQKEIGKDEGGFAGPAFEQYKKDHPQFQKVKSTLTFADNKSLFKPIEEENPTSYGFFDISAAKQNNITYTDLASGKSTTQKKVFEETFLVKDSVRNIHWKITDETREIAGYTCRRANAIIMDSVYVVAFYTDRIHVSGGPESFTGLPGMILGLALPHENITWFATKVTDSTIPENAVVPPKKGKPVNNKELKTTLQSVMKNWGDEAQTELRAFLM